MLIVDWVATNLAYVEVPSGLLPDDLPAGGEDGDGAAVQHQDRAPELAGHHQLAVQRHGFEHVSVQLYLHT